MGRRKWPKSVAKLQREMDPTQQWQSRCERLKASDRRAFEEIYRDLRDDLLRYVVSVVRDGATAHDLVQDVFVSLWQGRERLDPTLSLRAYLFRMARNRAYRHLRDERIHARRLLELPPREEASLDEPPEQALDADVLGERLHAWMGELPERQQEALTLSRFHGLSHREVAEAMEISPRTVNNHIVRALEFLHARLQRFQSVAR